MPSQVVLLPLTWLPHRYHMQAGQSFWAQKLFAPPDVSLALIETAIKDGSATVVEKPIAAANI